MTNDHIIRILREAALSLKHDFDAANLRFVEINNRSYDNSEFQEFKRDLLEAGSKIQMMFLEYSLDSAALREFLKKEDGPVLLFQKTGDHLTPALIVKSKSGTQLISLSEATTLQQSYDAGLVFDGLTNELGQVIFFVVVAYQSLVSDYGFDQSSKGESMSPVRRLLRLLSTERKDILYILFYAVIIGMTSLVLPLGIQSTVELISGGVFFSSVY